MVVRDEAGDLVGHVVDSTARIGRLLLGPYPQVRDLPRSGALGALCPDSARTTTPWEVRRCDSRLLGLAFDGVVSLEDLWSAGKLDSDVGQNGHHPLSERLQLLLRVPNLADVETVVRPEEDVVLQAVRRPGSSLLESTDAFFVLLFRQVRGVEADNDAHETVLLARGRADLVRAAGEARPELSLKA